MEMQQLRYKKVVLTRWAIGAALCGMVFLPASQALAGDVTVPITAEIQTTLNERVTQDMSFGRIPLSPLGDTITLEARTAMTGAASASSKGITITGSTPGIITITAQGPFVVKSTLTDTATLTDPVSHGTVEVSAIQANSTDLATGVTATGSAGNPYEAVAYIGGVLTLTGTEAEGTYAGNVAVTLTYEAP